MKMSTDDVETKIESKTSGTADTKEDETPKQTGIANEKAQEAKLRAKYPALKGPGSSAFLQKRLSKGQKYFDSGDYNMAKAKTGSSKQPITTGPKLLLPGSTGDTIPTLDSVPQRKPSLITQSKLAGLS